MWKLIFHIETIFNMEIGFYEPNNYQLEAEVSADDIFEAIKHRDFYLRGVGDIELKDDGHSGGDHIRVFENCILTEE